MASINNRSLPLASRDTSDRCHTLAHLSWRCPGAIALARPETPQGASCLFDYTWMKSKDNHASTTGTI
jgi:hypothetical protein